MVSVSATLSEGAHDAPVFTPNLTAIAEKAQAWFGDVARTVPLWDAATPEVLVSRLGVLERHLDAQCRVLPVPAVSDHDRDIRRSLELRAGAIATYAKAVESLKWPN